MKNLEEQATNLYNLALESYKGLSGYSWIIRDKNEIINSFKKSLPLKRHVNYVLASRTENVKGIYKVVFKLIGGE